MAPRSKANGADTDADASMSDVPDHRIADDMEVDETPDYTDSDTNPNTTASSVVGDAITDGRKRRTEANQLRRSIFGKKHDVLGESKVRRQRKLI
jgi:SWI/SNF-related matrix-associated actin-dependent regulator of chromatin subfamily A member 5